MATLILTAVGTAVGGPIGGAIGAIVGQQIDQAVFKPAARQGPRLTDLAVQSSSYGAQIPRLFGRVRVSGTVIWSTDLIETKKRQSNGKGRASTDTYSYSASFAVLLSARAIAGVGRIWADGNLLRGAAGDLKVEGALRLHLGDPDAARDPLLASAEANDAPAYRGQAYAVFEGLQLGDYGNRIPSLSFEVIADAAPVPVGTMLAELGAVQAEPGPTVDGFAATGGSVRAVVDSLAAAFPVTCHDEGQGVKLRYAPIERGALTLDDLGTHVGADPSPRLALDIDPLDATPTALTLAYFDGARDYQPGLQRARREGAGLREARIDLPATLDAGRAHALVAAVLARMGTQRARATVTLPWRALELRPGESVKVAGEVWRIAQLHLEHMVVVLDLVRLATLPTPIATASAAPGRIVGQVDAPPGATTLVVIDLPPLADTAATHASIAVFAAGASRGWRRALLLASTDGGATFDAAGTTALPATLGTTMSVLRPATHALIDRVNSVEVALLNPEMVLFDADTDALLTGANRAMLGDELLQFGRAQRLGAGRWLLSDLWRGRRGTEGAVLAHPAGSRFVVIDADTAALLAAQQTLPGVVVMAAGIGDHDPYPRASAATAARAVMPLAPVALVADALPSGDVEVRWTRRSRAGWAWHDGLDAPLAEEREAYRVTRTVGDIRTVDEVSEPRFIYAHAKRVADAAVAPIADFTVVQVGTGAVSDPAPLTLPLT